jgi:hypothetical protein
MIKPGAMKKADRKIVARATKESVYQPATTFVILVLFVSFIAPEPVRFRADFSRKYLIPRLSALIRALFKKNLFPLKTVARASRPCVAAARRFFGLFWRFLGFFGSKKEIKKSVMQPQAGPFVLVLLVPFIASNPALFPRKYLIVRVSARKCALFDKNIIPLKTAKNPFKPIPSYSGGEG